MWLVARRSLLGSLLVAATVVLTGGAAVAHDVAAAMVGVIVRREHAGQP